jgi:hypothetical protein
LHNVISVDERPPKAVLARARVDVDALQPFFHETCQRYWCFSRRYWVLFFSTQYAFLRILPKKKLQLLLTSWYPGCNPFFCADDTEIAQIFYFAMLSTLALFLSTLGAPPTTGGCGALGHPVQKDSTTAVFPPSAAIELSSALDISPKAASVFLAENFGKAPAQLTSGWVASVSPRRVLAAIETRLAAPGGASITYSLAGSKLKGEKIVPEVSWEQLQATLRNHTSTGNMAAVIQHVQIAAAAASGKEGLDTKVVKDELSLDVQSPDDPFTALAGNLERIFARPVHINVYASSPGNSALKPHTDP